MTVHWDTRNCPNWSKNENRSSARELSMAMWGYDNFAVRVEITKDNYKDIARYIHKTCTYTNFKTNLPASLRMHYTITRNAIGFVRTFMG